MLLVLWAHLVGTRFGPGAARNVQAAGLPGNLPFVLISIIRVVLVMAAVVALGFIVYGGFRYIAARGEEQELESAKRMITGAILGLVAIGLAAAFVQFVVAAVLS